MRNSSPALAPPSNVRAAPTHPCPYGFYSQLARGRRFFRDEALGCWVAASASAVHEVLRNPICLTRPAHERIPLKLQDGAAAGLFGRLVRLRDDDMHARLKQAVEAAVRSLDLAMVAELACVRASELDAELGPQLDESSITRFMFALPVQVIARLLGLSQERFNDVMGWLSDYGAAAAAAGTGIPDPTPALIARGHAGAEALLDLMRELYREPRRHGPLLAALVEQSLRAEIEDDEEVVANAVGLMVQGFAAVASVIGLTLLTLCRRPELRQHVASDRAELRELIAEVLRFDSSTHSTLRFMAKDGVIAGQQLRAGDVIIPMLAAAGRDPALNARPDEFDVDRIDRKSLEFGAGAHACPADKFAPLLVEVAVAHLLKRGVPLDRLESTVAYAPSAHIRTPRFTSPAEN